jgi:ATP-dependent helicase/nuclease subunit A
MSIHQSKGLEFPIVVVADMDRRETNRGPRIRFDPELGPLVKPPQKFERDVPNIGRQMSDLMERSAEQAELRRLLYVATTRAADHLILSAALKSTDEWSSTWMNLLASRFDLRTGRPALDASTGKPVIPPRSLADVPAIHVHASRPEPPRAASAPKSVRLPLDRFREAVLQSEPIPLPKLLEPLPPDATASRSFSVSHLERVAPPAEVFDGADWGLAVLDGSQTDPDLEPADDVDRERLGKLVHAALERVCFAEETRSVDSVNRLITSCWDAAHGELAPAMQQAAAAMVGGFLRSPLAVELAGSPRVFRELEFFLRWPLATGSAPSNLVTGKIDCAYQTDQGGWAILDYKTVAARSKSEAAMRLREFSFQLGVYCLALEQWLGRPPDRVELVLLRSGGARVWLRPSAPFLTEAVSRLESAIAAMTLERCDHRSTGSADQLAR